MAVWRIESPEGSIVEVEGEDEPTQQDIEGFFAKPEPSIPPIEPPGGIQFPTLGEGATLADVLRQPTPIIQPETGVVRSVLPGVLQPEDLKPSVRLIGGEQVTGEIGDTHPEIIKRESIPAIEIDQRGFQGPQGEFFPREEAAIATGLPTLREPTRLHSTDLSAAGEQQIPIPPSKDDISKQLQKEFFQASLARDPEQIAIKAQEDWYRSRGLPVPKTAEQVIEEKVRKASMTAEEMEALGLPKWLAPVERGVAGTAGAFSQPENIAWMAAGGLPGVGKVMGTAFMGQIATEGAKEIAGGTADIIQGNTEQGIERITSGVTQLGAAAAPTAVSKARRVLKGKTEKPTEVAAPIKAEKPVEVPTIQNIIEWTPEKLAEWKARTKTYGQDQMRQIASEVTPEQLPQLEEARAQLRQEVSDTLKSVEGGTLEERLNAAQSVGIKNLKVQTLTEMIENAPKPTEALPTTEPVRVTTTTPTKDVLVFHGEGGEGGVAGKGESWYTTDFNKALSHGGTISFLRLTPEEASRFRQPIKTDFVVSPEVLKRSQTLDRKFQQQVYEIKPEPATQPVPVVPTAPDIISRLESLKMKPGTAGLASFPHPEAFKSIGRDVWNTAIDIAIASIKAGRAIGSAIDEAIAHIKTKTKDFDELTVRAGLTAALTEESKPGYGIAHRVSEARGVAAERGKGIAPEDSVERGRQLLASGLDPQSVVDLFNKTKAVRADDIAVARAHGETLAKAADVAADRFGLDSPEYKAAAKADADWIKQVKPMQTEWHRAGMAQQGETDINTGSYHGLRRAHLEDTGKDFTPKQSKQAQGVAKKVKTADTAEQGAKEKLFKNLAETKSMSSAEQSALDAANKTVREAAIRMANAQNKGRIAQTVRDRQAADIEINASRKALEAAQKRAKNAAIKAAAVERRRAADPMRTVWEKAKEYIDKGEDNFDEIRNKIATDLGMSVDKVTRLMTQEKRAKFLADDLWRKQQTARQLRTQAKLWLQNLETPLYKKAIASVPRILFGLKVGFHGTVALGTHAPYLAFQPRFWNIYVRDFVKMYRMVGSPAYYEAQVQNLIRRKNYITARKGGLVNDPAQYEDYNSPKVAQYIGFLSGMGNRGYAVLKILRQDMFDQMWDKLPRTSQTQEMSDALSDGINHSTGVVKGKAPPGTNIALFAPRLEASRVMWLAGDPVRAADTFLRWNKATEAEKMFAMNIVKERLWVAGTMFSMLALNQGFLSATRSDQKINGLPESMGGAGFDPMRSDFLKFKVADMNLSYGNAMLTMARLPLRLWVGIENENKFSKIVYEDENVWRTLGGYARSQASPFAGLIMNLGFGRDFQERPLPRAGFGFLEGKTNIPKRLQAQGITMPYTWTELWSEQLAPIPFQEAIVEVYKTGMGMDKEQITQMKKALATIAVMGATGSRFTEDIPYQAPAPRTFKEALQQQ